MATLSDLESRLGSATYALALALLKEPWTLGASDIEVLPTILRSALQTPPQPSHSEDPEQFLAKISALDYADRLALVYHAERFHAAAQS